jgi:glycerol-3-phosphate dehydrogenase
LHQHWPLANKHTISNKMINDTFSFHLRNEFFQKSSQSDIDLLVIGGGITGAGIALDAVLRGMKVVLIEKNDFASGTSSRSTKLIHGGLRYLKQLEFALVKEVGTERAVVHNNARHLVLPEKMLLPIVKNGSLSEFSTSIGLAVYDFLAGVKLSERRKMLDKEATRKAEPMLNASKLLAGAMYFEYRTDDARLTIEIIKKAVEKGAICLNYAEAFDLISENGVLKGVKVFDHIDQQNHEIRAAKIVNAAGPWVDLIRKKDNSLEGKRLQLTKGVHLVVPHEKLPIKQAAYFDVPDGRMIFAIPRNGKTYLGTTDTVYNELIDSPQTTIEDVEYVLNAVNEMFPGAHLKKSHVESTWAGLRPLIHEDGKSPSELSRKDEIFISKSGLISIAGGKLTGYRKMAERIVNIVASDLSKNGKKFGKCKTKNQLLSGADFEDSQSITDFIIRLTGEAKQVKLNVNHIKDWVYKYGTNSSEILEIAYDICRTTEDVDMLAISAEFIYCMKHEMVLTLSDFLIRRSGRLYFDRPKVKIYIDELNTLLKDYAGFDDEYIKNQHASFMLEYNSVLDF